MISRFKIIKKTTCWMSCFGNVMSYLLWRYDKIRWNAWCICVFVVYPEKFHNWLDAGYATVHNTVRWLENIVSYIQEIKLYFRKICTISMNILTNHSLIIGRCLIWSFHSYFFRWEVCNICKSILLRKN